MHNYDVEVPELIVTFVQEGCWHDGCTAPHDLLAHEPTLTDDGWDLVCV